MRPWILRRCAWVSRPSRVRRTRAWENAKRSWPLSETSKISPAASAPSSAAARSSPCRSLTRSSDSSSNSEPITAATSSSRTQASCKRDRRRLTTSRTPSGTSAVLLLLRVI